MSGLTGTEVLEVLGQDATGRPAATTEQVTTQQIADLATGSGSAPVVDTVTFNGSTSGTTVLEATAIASGTLRLPAATDTLVGKATTDTLTNKTLTAPVINGTITGSYTLSGTHTLGTTLTVADAVNIALNATTGTKIGTATTQKLGLYNATPVAQHSATGDVTGFVAGSGTPANDDSVYAGAAGATAYTVGDLVTALKAIGILAA